MKYIILIIVTLLPAAVLLRAADLTGHKLLVTSVRTGDTEVFIADPTTGDLFNVSRSPKSEDRYPCWSPDGKRICFMSDREGTTNLWVCNADGSKVRRLNRTPDVCYMPSWQKTPRGERIVFGQHGDKPGLTSIKPDGTDARSLGEGHDPTLAPDGKLITYTGHEDGGVTVFVMNHDGTNKRQVVKEISKVGATFPNWSPDSRQLVYSFPVGDALELFIINLDSSGQRQLTTFDGTSVCTPSAWSPDAQWISFCRTSIRAITTAAPRIAPRSRVFRARSSASGISNVSVPRRSAPAPTGGICSTPRRKSASGGSSSPSRQTTPASSKPPPC